MVGPGYLIPSVPSVLGLAEVPLPIGAPDWYVTARATLSVIYLVLGIIALVLLVMSFIRSGEERGAVPSGR